MIIDAKEQFAAKRQADKDIAQWKAGGSVDSQFKVLIDRKQGQWNLYLDKFIDKLNNSHKKSPR